MTVVVPAVKIDPSAYRLIETRIREGWLTERCAQRIIHFYGRGITEQDVRTILEHLRGLSWQHPEVDDPEVLLFGDVVRGFEHRSASLYTKHIQEPKQGVNHLCTQSETTGQNYASQLGELVELDDFREPPLSDTEVDERTWYGRRLLDLSRSEWGNVRRILDAQDAVFS